MTISQVSIEVAAQAHEARVQEAIQAHEDAFNFLQNRGMALGYALTYLPPERVPESVRDLLMEFRTADRLVDAAYARFMEVADER